MQPTYQSENATIYQGDNTVTLVEIEPKTIDCGLDSPPYFALCDYRHELQHGLEPSIEKYLEVQAKVRSLQLKTFKEGGVLAIVIDDTVNNYSAVRGKDQRKKAGEWVKRREPQPGYREKEIIQVSAKYVDMMQDLGWHLILERFWDKGTGGRRTAFGSSTVEHILFFVKQSTGRRLNPLHFIPFNSSLLKGLPTSHPEHPCPFPVPLATDILKHICPPKGLVQDIYCGTGSSGLAALGIGAKYQGFDLNCQWAISAIQKEEARKVDQLELFAI